MSTRMQISKSTGGQPAPAPFGVLQRTCSCGGECPSCKAEKSVQRQTARESAPGAAPEIVNDVLRSSGQPLDSATRSFMEPRFGHDFSKVRVHTDGPAAESANAVNSLAYTVGQNVVFAKGQYAPHSREGQRLLAHELTHTIQQGPAAPGAVQRISSPGDSHEKEAESTARTVMESGGKKSGTSAAGAGTLQRQADETADAAAPGDTQTSQEGVEVGDQVMMLLPRSEFVTVPADAGADLTPMGNGTLQRDAGKDDCDTPTKMRKVTSGKFEGGKTLDDYYPDLVGTKTWDKNDTAGPYDNGFRAGSAVQLIGEYMSPCAKGGSNYTLHQSAHIVRAKMDGKQMMEGGKAMEGTTIDDIKRSGRDQSKAPFRQEFNFAVSMADPISGVPYNTLKAYEWEVNLTTSLSGPGGAKSVDWGVTVEATNGKVTKNEVR